MTAYIVPVVMAAILLHGLYKGVNIYEALLAGVKRGLSVCAGIFPAVLVMLVLVAMLRASGAVELAGRLLAPVIEPLGIPADCLPLALLRPFTGSGALSLGSEIMREAGPDSLPGRIAAVMLGASETSLYTLAVYSGYLGIKNTGYTLPASLAADAAAYIMSGIAVRLLMAP